MAGALTPGVVPQTLNSPVTLAAGVSATEPAVEPVVVPDTLGDPVPAPDGTSRFPGQATLPVPNGNGAAPVAARNSLFTPPSTAWSCSMDEEATLSSEAQYLALQLQYDSMSGHYRSHAPMVSPEFLMLLGVAVFVVALAAAPATGGGSLLFAW